MIFALLSSVAIASGDIALADTPVATTVGVVVNQDAHSASVQTETIQENDDNVPSSLSDAIVNDPVTLPNEQAGPLVFADLSDAVVVEKVQTYIQSIKTLEADFTQIAPSGSLATGKLHLRRPGQLRFEYEPPTPLLIVATQGNVYVEDKDLETTDFYPIKKTPLRFLLSKKIDLGDAEVVAVDRGVDTVAVTFASTEEETEGELSVILRAPEFRLEQWAVRDVQNGITIVTLNNVEEGGKFRNALFRAPESGGEFLKN